MIRLRFCTIQLIGDGCRVRFLWNGHYCDARPHKTPHYHVIAHRCGYGDNVSRYCIEHEFAHCFVEERLFGRPSQVLWGLAHHQPVTTSLALYEEATAQMFQRWLRANERPILAGVDWDGLKRDALELLDDVPQRSGTIGQQLKEGDGEARHRALA
jgi:hypothetical protein